ncbi:MAG: hypothetical protein ACYC4N_09010 [Pirellulaceae bacterium]
MNYVACSSHVARRWDSHRCYVAMVAYMACAAMIGTTAVRAQAPGTGPAPNVKKAARTKTSERTKLARDAVADQRVPEPVELSPTLAGALAEFNRGAANMEKYEYAKAARAFNKVLEAAPDWTAARFNRGLAYLNMAGAN